mgnify:CR=1 FL=1
MIRVEAFRGKTVAVFGLARSGISSARALIDGGASVIGWDEKPEARTAAEADGIPVRNLNELNWTDIAALILSPGVPLTHRGLATGVRYLTGHCRADLPLDLDWTGLADPSTTLVVYMGLANVEEIVRNLILHGLPGATPALAVCQGTTPRQRQVYAALADLPGAAKAAGFDGPVLFIIGQVAMMAVQRAGQDDAACESEAVVA